MEANHEGITPIKLTEESKNGKHETVVCPHCHGLGRVQVHVLEEPDRTAAAENDRSRWNGHDQAPEYLSDIQIQALARNMIRVGLTATEAQVRAIADNLIDGRINMRAATGEITTFIASQLRAGGLLRDWEE